MKARILILLLFIASLSIVTPTSAIVDQEQIIRLTSQIESDLNFLNELKNTRKLSFSFLRSLEEHERLYLSIKDEIKKTGSVIKPKAERRIIQRLEAIARDLAVKRAYFIFAPTSATGPVSVKFYIRNKQTRAEIKGWRGCLVSAALVSPDDVEEDIKRICERRQATCTEGTESPVIKEGISAGTYYLWARDSNHCEPRTPPLPVPLGDDGKNSIEVIFDCEGC